MDRARLEGGAPDLEALERDVENARAARDEDLRDLDMPRDVLAPRLEAHESRIAAAQQLLEEAAAAAGPGKMVLRSEDLERDGLAGVQGALEQLDMRVVLGHGRAPLTERVTLEPRD